MVHHQPPSMLVSGMRTLDNPSLGQDDEAVGISLDGKQARPPGADPATYVLVGRMPHHLDADVVALQCRLRTLAGITALW